MSATIFIWLDLITEAPIVNVFIMGNLMKRKYKLYTLNHVYICQVSAAVKPAKCERNFIQVTSVW